MGFGLCHVILGNRGGPARGWFSEEWPPARALVGGEVPPPPGGGFLRPGSRAVAERRPLEETKPSCFMEKKASAAKIC